MSEKTTGLAASARRALVVGVVLTVLLWAAYVAVALSGLGEGLVMMLVRVLAIFVFVVAFSLAGRGMPTSDCGPLVGWLRETPGRRWMTVAALVVLYVVVQVAFAGTDGAVGYAGDWLRMLLLGVEAYLFTAAGTVS